MNNGFVRLAACVPELRVGDPEWNAGRILESYARAEAEGAAVAVFPELSVTGYTCGDLFATRALLDASDKALASLAAATAGHRCLLVAGAPMRVGSRLFNAAAVMGGGRILGLPFKEFLPEYREFYEKRQFRSAREFGGGTASFGGAEVPAGQGLVFKCGSGPDAFCFGVEICEDLWSVVPPSLSLALNGAQAILNLSAGTELAAKADFRRSLVAGQSARICGAYLLCGAGVHESTADAVFSGHALVAFNGRILAESERFARKATMTLADVNGSWCNALRAAAASFHDATAPAPARIVDAPALAESPDISRSGVQTLPFVPQDPETRPKRCQEVFSIQAAGLAKRIEHVRARRLVVGVSGGLDSTLAMLASAKAVDLLGMPRRAILAVTMPGFGTTARTRGNAEALAAELGAELRTIPIGPAVERHFADIGHDPSVRDVVYENAQARERTQVLMDLANQEGGLLVGTGDLSEIALGWSTFNGDHMSMYNPNCGVPKSLIRLLVRCEADASPPALAAVLRDIADTPVSPELLPGGSQSTEGVLGRYELHDFFLYHFLKYGESPERLRNLALHAFAGQAGAEEIDSALRVFVRRFLSQQFKRNASPDGPKVGSVALSPRGDWRCPPDAAPAALPMP